MICPACGGLSTTHPHLTSVTGGNVLPATSDIPTTSAGRRLVEDMMAADPSRWVNTPWEFARRVRAIEREAAANDGR